MRLTSAEKLASVLDSLPEHPRVVVSGNAATPWSLLDVLDKTVERYVLHLLNAQPGLPDREGVTLETAFVGPGMRGSPRLAYVPARLSLVPKLYRSALAPDLVVVHTSLPRDGKVSLGAEVNVLLAAVEAARARGGRVVAQLDSEVPYTFGDAELPLDMVDWGVEASDPLLALTPAPYDDPAGRIAERVAARIPDGATLQLGIGAVPDAVLAGLSGRRRLRVWSEMISDGVVALERGGCLDPGAALSTSFLLGSSELYAWAHLNPRLRLRRTEVTNDPSRIAHHPRMVSVNAALQVDLFGQVNASRVRGRIHSGFGGQTDFIVGALHATEGQALIALRSWHPRAECSTIVPMIDEPLTSFQPSAVITEQGTAALFGRTQESQARELIAHAAHPSVREELLEEACALGLA